jgi:alpha-L-rhamnosidase
MSGGWRQVVRIVVALVVAAQDCVGAAGQGHLRSAVELRCDGEAQPLALEAGHARLTWQLEAVAGARDVTQSIVRVVIGTRRSEVARGRGDAWDSGLQEQREPAIVFKATLEPATEYWWSVQVWDEHGAASEWAAPARFVTAAEEWKAQWIQAPFSSEEDGAALDGSHPMPVFRRAFALKRQPVQALLAIAGLGQYEAHMNGARVSDAVIAQAWTEYGKTITYDTYDVTTKMHRGVNVIGVLLGNGMYNVQQTTGRYTKFEGSYGAPKMIAELRVRYSDGKSETIATDAQWQVSPGPIRFSSAYGGEDFDARAVLKGRGDATADTSTWSAAQVTQGPGGRLVAAIAPPVVEREHYTGRTVEKLPAAGPHRERTIFDLGQNFAGLPHIRVHGAAGAVLRITPGELLHPDGSVSQESSGGPQWWSYTLRGGVEESWQPMFSYYGFRYLELEWVKGTGTVSSVEGVATNSASAAGSFASSSETLNQIHALIVAAMHSNEVSLFTDCPHREKLGWLEETHLVAPGLLFNSDLEGLYRATAQNITDAQDASGMVPTIAPQYTRFGPEYPVYDDSPEWGSATVLAPWWSYRFNGDRDVLERNYTTMQRYMTYLEGRAVDGIVAYGLGDWYDIGPNPPGFSQNTTLGVTGTLMLYEDATVMARIATLLGKPEDEQRYLELAEREQAAFTLRFFHADTHTYDTGSQTASAMPLALGIVPEEHRAAVLQHVIDDIHAHQDHVTTGEVGYPYMVRLLQEEGRGDVLLAMLLRRDVPSYGSQIERGATTLTEAWDANPRNSQNHFMLGGAEEWFYRGLAGIDLDFSREKRDEQLMFRPTVLPGVMWARGSYRSACGEIRSEWHVERNEITLVVTVPAGMEATVVIPAARETALQESGAPIEKARGVSVLSREGARAVLHVGSGNYRFTSTLPGL